MAFLTAFFVLMRVKPSSRGKKIHSHEVTEYNSLGDWKYP